MKRLLMMWRLMASDVRALRMALAQTDRPVWLLPASIALAVFALQPLNFAFPVIGVVDDMVLLPLLLRGLVFLAAAARPSTLARSSTNRIVSVQ